MRKWSRYLVGVVAVTGLFVLVTHAGAETCTLEMKKVDTSARISSSGLPGAYLAQGQPGQNPGEGYIRVALVAPKENTQRALITLRDCLY